MKPVAGLRPGGRKELPAARRGAVPGGDVEVVDCAVPPAVARSGGRAGGPPAPRGGGL